MVEKLMVAITFPLLILKWSCWIVCAIWLLCVGDWRVVVGSLLAGWLGGRVLPLANGILMAPFFLLMNKVEHSPAAAGFIVVVARVLTCAILIAWCVFCMRFVLVVNGMSESTVIPRLLMSYCMAIHTIWNLTADNYREGGGGVANFISVMLCALGYLVVVVLLVCGADISLLTAIFILAGFLFLSIPVSVFEVVSMISMERDGRDL